jgi:hypothetical protein
MDGYAGMTLSQMALQTGILAPAMATFSILDAVTSVVLGITLIWGRMVWGLIKVYEVYEGTQRPPDLDAHLGLQG